MSREETFAEVVAAQDRYGRRKHYVAEDADMVLCDVCGFECILRDDYLHERHYECQEEEA